MKKTLFSLVMVSFLFAGVGVLAQDSNLPSAGITPDSPFYIFKTLKENIQTFFTFNAEQKARQYLHLADVRLAEYQKMLEKGKTDLAQKTLDKYEKQLGRAVAKVEELKNKGKDIKTISDELATTTAKHIQVLENNLQKIPEAGKRGIERALENVQKIKPADETVGLVPSGAEDWKTYVWDYYTQRFEFKYPADWTVEKSYYSTPAQGAAGEPPSVIGLNLYPPSGVVGDDLISMGGRQITCLPDQKHTKCDEARGMIVWTNTQNTEILKIFDKLISTFQLIEKDKTAGWKTYTNAQYGFEIKYPSDTKISNINDNDPLSSEPTLINILFEPVNAKRVLMINIRNKNSGCYDNALGADPELPTINGINFVKWDISKYLSTGIDTWGVGEEYCTAHDELTYGLIVEIKYPANSQVPGIEPVFNQMLSTFRFLK